MGSRHAIVAILLAGCGRVGFDPDDGGAGDAVGDGADGEAISLDLARTTWQKRGLATVVVRKLITTDTTIVAATSSGLHATSDRGGAWTELAGSAGVDAWSLIFDDNGSVVYGGVGVNLRRTALP